MHLMMNKHDFNSADFQIEYELSDADYNQPSRSWMMSKVTTHDALNIRRGGCSVSPCCSRWAGFAIQPNRITGYAILINNVQ